MPPLLKGGAEFARQRDSFYFAIKFNFVGEGLRALPLFLQKSFCHKQKPQEFYIPTAFILF